MPQGCTKQVRDRDGRQWRFLAECRLCTPGFKPNYVRFVEMDLCGFLNQDDAIVIGNVRGQRVEQRGLAGARAAGDQDVLFSRDRAGQLPRRFTSQRINRDKVVQAVATSELPDGENRAGHRTRREHRRHAGTVLEARIEKWLCVGDLVTARACDVLDRDRQIPRLESPILHSLDGAVALHEDVPAAVIDHDLGDRRIAEEILDRFQERQDPVQAAHNCPFATWSK